MTHMRKGAYYSLVCIVCLGGSIDASSVQNATVTHAVESQNSSLLHAIQNYQQQLSYLYTLQGKRLPIAPELFTALVQRVEDLLAQIRDNVNAADHCAESQRLVGECQGVLTSIWMMLTPKSLPAPVETSVSSHADEITYGTAHTRQVHTTPESNYTQKHTLYTSKELRDEKKRGVLRRTRHRDHHRSDHGDEDTSLT